MSFEIPLTSAEQAKLLDAAKAMGTTAEQILRCAIEPILTSRSEQAAVPKKPLKSMLGIWAQYGPGPSEQEIDENRAEMFSTFGRDDIG